VADDVLQGLRGHRALHAVEVLARAHRGGKAVMTSDSHERATERTAEALLVLEAQNPINRYDIIVMIQGDEPLIDPEMITQVINPLLEGKSQVSNLMVALISDEEVENTNNVKVVVGINGNALYNSKFLGWYFLTLFLCI